MIAARLKRIKSHKVSVQLLAVSNQPNKRKWGFLSLSGARKRWMPLSPPVRWRAQPALQPGGELFSCDSHGVCSRGLRGPRLCPGTRGLRSLDGAERNPGLPCGGTPGLHFVSSGLQDWQGEQFGSFSYTNFPRQKAEKQPSMAAPPSDAGEN
jgi:hypothetical protein